MLFDRSSASPPLAESEVAALAKSLGAAPLPPYLNFDCLFVCGDFFTILSVAFCSTDFAPAQQPTQHSPSKAVHLLGDSLLELIGNYRGAMPRHAYHHYRFPRIFFSE